MKFRPQHPEYDATDRAILELLQENCKQPLSSIGSKVGLSAPSVIERIHKLEEAGVIVSYAALLDAKRVGKDIAAFIGVSIDDPQGARNIESQIVAIEDVMECHHVTGQHTLLVKVKAEDTQALEALIDRIRSLAGVIRTETSVVLSTAAERVRIALDSVEEFAPEPTRRAGGRRSRRASK